MRVEPSAIDSHSITLEFAFALDARMSTQMLFFARDRDGTRAAILSIMARALLLAALLPLVGCAPGARTVDEADTVLAEDGADTHDIEAQASSLTAVFTLAPHALEEADGGSGTSPPPTPDEVLAAADRTRAFFAPVGCLTVAASPEKKEVTYVFSGCSGPWGLLRMHGTVIARYTRAPNGITVEVTTDDLRANRATVDYHATATITGDAAGNRAMTWKAELSGTTARGRAFERTADWSARWKVGNTCIAVDGTAEGNVTGRPVRTTVEGLSRCRGECPQRGGVVTVTNTATNKTLRIEFEGGNRATFTAANGRETTIVLACGL